jgi:hypothetical protein
MSRMHEGTWHRCLHTVVTAFRGSATPPRDAGSRAGPGAKDLKPDRPHAWALPVSLGKAKSNLAGAHLRHAFFGILRATSLSCASAAWISGRAR